MRKVLAAINMTLDGFCDHTAGIADEELHRYFNGVLRDSDVILYGRKTFELMESAWPEIVKNPTGEKAMDEFAVLIENTPKVVFSRSLKTVTWKNSRLANFPLIDEIMELRKQPGKYIAIGSPSLIAEAARLDLIDEYRLTIHPVILGSGLPLFRDIKKSILLKGVKSERLSGGQVTLYYEREKS
jgi:dihydrofolate reductase